MKKYVSYYLTAILASVLVLDIAQFSRLSLQISFANDQTQIFEELRTKALQSDVDGAVNCLEYLASYYPSGTKQSVGTELDHIVERSRKIVASDIINKLRSSTGKDFGDNPNDWISKLKKI